MKTIEISDETFSELSSRMRSNETSELLIKRLLAQEKASVSNGDTHKNETKKSLEEEKYIAQLESTPSTKFEIQCTEEEKIRAETFGKGNLPDLTHTKVLEVAINEKEVALKWNKIIQHLLIIIFYEEPSALPEAGLLIRDGEHSERGYDYIAEIGKSVQGADANQAGRAIVYLADKYNISVNILFGWRDKPRVYQEWRRKLGRIIVN